MGQKNEKMSVNTIPAHSGHKEKMSVNTIPAHSGHSVTTVLAHSNHRASPHARPPHRARRRRRVL